MNLFLNFQPIFDFNKNVFAYEMIYKSKKHSDEHSGRVNEESTKVIVDALSTLGIDRLTRGRPAYITFTKNLIYSEIATLLSVKHLIIELHDSIDPDDLIVEKCKSLKEKGYSIALSRYADTPQFLELLKIADIVRVDINNPDYETQLNFFKKHGTKGVMFVARNINTTDSFDAAKKLDIAFFQGNFFAEPEILSFHDISPLKYNYIQLISKVIIDEINFDEISRIVSRDIALSFRLLRLVNSVAFGFIHKVESIKQALVAMGSLGLKKWVSLMAINEIGEDKPDEITRLSLNRAKFAELLSNVTPLRNRSHDFFMVGLFSMLDVVMNRPMDEILKTIKINSDISQALLEKNGVLSGIYRLVLHYEKCEWDEIDNLLSLMKIPEEHLMKSYVDSTQWCNDIFQETMSIIDGT